MKIRIVGINSKCVWVQTKMQESKIAGNKMKNRYTDWVQIIMTRKDFENFIIENRPELYGEYKKAYKNMKTDLSVAEWFYHYNETEKMICEGIAAEF